ncbi:hypothetical protein GGI35DRAFT_487588 [Trichoderma velutinum]
MPHQPQPPRSPPPAPGIPREPTPFEILEQLEDERLAGTSALVRQITLEHYYAHLPNVELDWEIEGAYVCRVVGLQCYGTKSKSAWHFREHLRRAFHFNHNASQTPQEISPRPRRRPPLMQPATIQANDEPNIVSEVIETSDSDDLPMEGSNVGNIASEVVEIQDSGEPPMEIPRPAKMLPQIIEIEDSDESLIERESIQGEISNSQESMGERFSPASEITDSQEVEMPGLEYTSDIPDRDSELWDMDKPASGQWRSDDDSDSESMKSVIFVTSCEVDNCQRCALDFTVSTM